MDGQYVPEVAALLGLVPVDTLNCKRPQYRLGVNDVQLA
jgi:hypothetical protein